MLCLGGRGVGIIRQGAVCVCGGGGVELVVHV